MSKKNTNNRKKKRVYLNTTCRRTTWDVFVGFADELEELIEQEENE